MQINDNQKFIISITNVLDAIGSPAKLKGVPAWTFDSAALRLNVSEDGMSAVGTAIATGSTTVSVTADGITRSAAFDVVAGAAVTFDLEVTLVSE